MHDQIHSLPPAIQAATLSGSLSKSEAAAVTSDLCEGRLKVLYVSPERLCSASFKRLLRTYTDHESGETRRKLPEVSLLCVDEVHCLSQWSHNFRSSYMRLRSIIPLLQPKSVLALTATAPPTVIDDVCKTLSIPPNRCPAFADVSLKEVDNPRFGDPTLGVRVMSTNRKNIDPAIIFVDSDDSRRSLLSKMLKPAPIRANGPPKSSSLSSLCFSPGCLSSGSVIIYVWTKRQAEALSSLLNTSDIEGGVTFYHAGMTASDRATSQSNFMRGKSRVIVATVAFGLGIDKGDVKAVVHCCMPKSFEHYIQGKSRRGEA